jgi:Zn-dependent alcohol dehydrogenase
MARYMKHYPLREFVSHRYSLREVETAVHKAIAPDSMKVVIEPWS